MKHRSTDIKDTYTAPDLMAFKNAVIGCVWCLALIGSYLLIGTFLDMQYGMFCDAGSMRAYRANLSHYFLWVAILAVVWWGCAVNPLIARLRSFFEQHSFPLSLIFSMGALIGTALLYFLSGKTGSGIYDEKEIFYPLVSAYILPTVFIAVMYVVPPVNISKVILPARSEKKLTIAKARIFIIAAAVITVLVLMDLP